MIKSNIDQQNEYKNKIHKLEFEASEYSFLRDKNQVLNKEIERLQLIIEELNKELTIYRFKIAEHSSLMSKIEE